MVYDCPDSLALLSQVNIDLDQNKCDHIIIDAYYLDNHYHALRKMYLLIHNFFMVMIYQRE